MLGTLARHVTRIARRGRDLATGRTDATGEYDAVRRGVAEQLYRQTLARGGWAADIGCFGPDLFLSDASECLAAIALGNAQGGPPTP